MFTQSNDSSILKLNRALTANVYHAQINIDIGNDGNNTAEWLK